MAEPRGADWGLEGLQVSWRWALALMYDSGIHRKWWLIRSIAVMNAESARWTKAWHANRAEDGTISSTDRGIWQINDKAHPNLTIGQMYDATYAASYAAQLSNWGADMTPWYAFTTGSYERYVAKVRDVYDQGGWTDHIGNSARYLAKHDVLSVEVP